MVFGVSNAKYLAFDIPDGSALKEGEGTIKYFFYYYFFYKHKSNHISCCNFLKKKKKKSGVAKSCKIQKVVHFTHFSLSLHRKSIADQPSTHHHCYNT